MDGTRVPYTCTMSILLPQSPQLAHWSSLDLEPVLRPEAWRHIAHRWVDYLPSGETPINAELTTLRGEDCIFGTTRSSAYEMRSSPRHLAHGEDMVVLALIQTGEMRLNAGAGEHQRQLPGALGLYAPQHAAHYRWHQDTRQTYVALPRRVASAALGHEPGNLAITPKHSVLAPALASQLSHLGMLVRNPSRLDETELAGLLEATRTLALLLLRNLGRGQASHDLPDTDGTLHAGRRAAALRFMEQHASQHDLSPDHIAQGIGCSRTRLYVAFADIDSSVMAQLRELRLQRARVLIEQSARLHVGALSWRCGFSDASEFSKQFRARFGLAPTDWHRQAWMAPD